MNPDSSIKSIRAGTPRRSLCSGIQRRVGDVNTTKRLVSEIATASQKCQDDEDSYPLRDDWSNSRKRSTHSSRRAYTTSRKMSRTGRSGQRTHSNEKQTPNPLGHVEKNDTSSPEHKRCEKDREAKDGKGLTDKIKELGNSQHSVTGTHRRVDRTAIAGPTRANRSGPDGTDQAGHQSSETGAKGVSLEAVRWTRFRMARAESRWSDAEMR